MSRWLYRHAAECGLGLLSLPIFFYGLGGPGPVNNDEALYHGIAEQMVASGDWLSLVFRGEERTYDVYMNAPLHYWARALLISVFGSSYWTMRLLSAGFGLATVLAVQRLALGLGGRRAGLLAGLVQLTTLQFVFLHGARTGELETLVTFGFSLAALLFWRGVTGRGGFVGHHLCLAALMCTKLPVVVMPLAAELAVFGCVASTRPHLRRWLATGAALLPIGALWHLANALADPAGFSDVVATMFAEGTGAEVDHGLAWRLEHVRFYAAVLILGTAPWAFALPLAAGFVVARIRACADPTGWWIVGLYALSVLVFFAAIGKQLPWYIQPAYPFFAASIGVWLAQLTRKPLPAGWIAGLAAVIALTLCLNIRITRFNPFGFRAIDWYLKVNWHSLADLGAPATALAATAATAGLLFGLRAWRRAAFDRFAGIVLVALLVGFAGLRVVAPLRKVDYVSPLEALHRELDALPPDTRIPEPISLPDFAVENWRLEYYFKDEFVLVPHDPDDPIQGVDLYFRNRSGRGPLPPSAAPEPPSHIPRKNAASSKPNRRR